MKTPQSIFTGVSAIVLSALSPIFARAYTDLSPSDVINSAAPTLTDTIVTTSASSTITEAVPVFLAEQAAVLVTAIAIISSVIAGLRLAFSQSEEAVNVARRTFIASAAAVMLVALALRIREALFQSETDNVIDTPSDAIAIFCDEVMGIIDLVQIPLIAVAVLMIIIHGIRAVVSYGSDDGAASLRRAVVATMFGVLIIAVREIFTEAVLDSTDCTPGTVGTPDPIIEEIIRIINLILNFIGLLAVVVICIAGIMMIVNVGNDDQYSRARNLLFRVVIGLLVILVSLGIVNLVLTGLTS